MAAQGPGSQREMEIPSGDPQTGELYDGRRRAYTRNFGRTGIIVLQTVQVDKIEAETKGAERQQDGAKGREI